MDKRAYSGNDVELMDFPAELYAWDALPEGEWNATLDMRVWGNSMNLLCYFTGEDGSKFRLSAFRANKGPGKDKWYTAQDGMLDMSSTDIQLGRKFTLATGKNTKGNPRWNSVKPL